MVGGGCMKIKFCEFNSSLGTRRLGNSIRQSIITNMGNEEKIIFDFENVELISNSFADECFGKLIDEFGLQHVKGKTTFVNTNGLVSLVLRKAISDRLSNKRNVLYAER